MYIYIATNSVNGKQYVGQSINHPHTQSSGRINAHKSSKSQIPFHRAIRKHGFSTFTWDVLWYPYASQDALNSIEQNFIKNLNTLSPHGYNLGSGGKSGGSLCSKTRAKISAAHTGKKRTPEARANIAAGNKGKNYGKSRPPEVRAKISKTLKGRKPTAEHRANLSKATKGRKFTDKQRAKISGKNNHKYGKPMPTKTRAKISKTMKGSTQTPEHRRNAVIGRQKKQLKNSNQLTMFN